MTRGDIIKKILSDIAYRTFHEPQNAADRDNMLQTINLSIQDAVEDFKEPATWGSVSRVHKNAIDAIEHFQILDRYFDDEVTAVPKYFLYTVKDDEDYNYLLKVNTCVSPYVVTCRCFRTEDDNVVYLKEEPVVWDAVLRLWQNIDIYSDEAKVFWTQLAEKNIENYYLAVDGEANELKNDKAWRLYAYTYFSIISESKFPIPKCLQTQTSKFKNPLALLPYAKYDQFFDTYNVLNEVKHANDKLTKYLKTYHVVEQFAYREKFINLINDKKDKDCSLVRRLEALTDTFAQKETEVVVRSINRLFPDIPKQLNGQIGDPKDVLSPKCRLFLQQKYEISPEDGKQTYSEQSVGQMIYNIRNSIVHNKETEFHLTFNNVSEYKDIIPLIDFFTDHLIKGIISIIESHIKNNLLYKRKTLKLY